ncbi:MAG: hypothetical protein QGF00_20610 [Planctomycetota bacterium]|nr:hypothetical protein [Planctomycetota bacterium]
MKTASKQSLIQYRESIQPVARVPRGHRIKTKPEAGPERLLWRRKRSPHHNRTRCENASTPGSGDLPPV